MSKVMFSKLKSDKNEIRLLELLAGRWMEDVCCKLQIVSLDDNPTYDALSYVWGDPGDTDKITVDGCSFQATRNLIGGLRRLRSSRDAIILWVDAICIDQANNQEKMQQVGIMADIYMSASSVQIFLGESGILDLIPEQEQATWDDPPRFEWHRDHTMLFTSREPPNKAGVSYNHSKPRWDPKEGIRDQARVDAFLAWQKEAEHSSAERTALQTCRDSQAGAFAIMNILSNGRCLKSCLCVDSDSVPWKKAIEVIGHLTNLPWWTRAWVLQEVILPKGDVIAIYGEITAPIGLIEDSGAILPRHYERGQCCKNFWSTLPSDQKQILGIFAEIMGYQEGIREVLGILTQDQIDRLLFLLQKTRHKEATNPRDKIYGLLGLLHNSPNPLHITPDYDREVSHIYTDVAMRFINYQKSLFVLLNHEFKASDSGLPTWVPHWGKSWGSSSDYLITQRMLRYMAWPPGEGLLPELVDNYALNVKAKFIDRITATTRVLVKAETDLGEICEELETFFGDDLARERNGENAFWRTMWGDLLYQFDRSSISTTIAFDRASDGDGSMFTIAQLAWEKRLDNMFFLNPDGTLISDEEVAHIARFAEENFWYANEDRIFFKTAKGYIGSGPPDTKVGNSVFLIFGSPVPMILRLADTIPTVLSARKGTRLPPCYCLVGYAYVYGIMDGEVAPKNGHGKAKGRFWKMLRRFTGPWYAKRGSSHQIYLV
ncbi:uncharacterized protein K444DRAFT_580185 [Hyaloscypha bicolor E]|uniref:Heterokaryon incompatibility domain-containing protein n=1 Tax=Hyaloscypha bicolor E TaxID=1095630 RepID=A0A2J6TUW9_9HELO|nr:uncharacterized protein K444DRAFT_580185 [Hyaloscypha bicolor E]PMD66822.1 hypothetical protein K444DRAFT_580185 [Hyaloscypha bicolor E]